MTTLHGWGLPEQHLALDALVAFVDGELTPCAYDRAAAHVARCQACAAEAAVQRNARTAVRSAGTPSMSPQLLRALQSIPSEAELPGQPDELGLSENGQLVTVNRKDPSTRLGTGTVLGSSTPLGASQPLGGSPAQDEAKQTADHPSGNRHYGRRTRQGAGVVFSGLVLGTLALINLPVEDQRAPGNFGPRSPHPGDAYSNGTVPASNETSERPQLRPPMQPQIAAHTSVLPSESSAPPGP